MLYKHILCIMIFINIIHTVNCQYFEKTYYDSDSLIRLSNTAFDNNEYSKSIELLDAIHYLDPNYLTAQYEKSRCLHAEERNEEAIQLLESLRSTDKFDEMPMLYLSLGSLYSDLGEFNLSEEVFLEGINVFPAYDQLIFNLGIMYYSKKDFQKAVDYLKTAIYLNPNNSRAHYLLGAIAFEQGMIAEGTLAYLALLANSPFDVYSKYAIASLSLKMSTNYLEKTQIKFSDSGDDFSELNLILRNELPLNKKYPLKSDIDDIYTRHLQAVLEYASVHDVKNGFFEKTYIPFLADINNKGWTEAFTYFSLSSLENEIGKPIKKKKDIIQTYIDEYYLKDFWNLFALREMDVFGQMQEVLVLLDYNKPSLIGPVLGGKKEGVFKSIDQYGRITHKINYTNDLANGNVIYYNVNGDIARESEYKDGIQEGIEKNYYSNGQLKSINNYTNGELNGIEKTYYISGKIDCENNLKAGNYDGTCTCYYQNGNKRVYVNYSKNKLNGKRIDYYSNGDISYTQTFVDDKLDGLYESYDYDGNIITEIQFSEGAPQKTYTSLDLANNINIESVTTENTRIEKVYEINKLVLINTYIDNKLTNKKYYDEGVLYFEEQYDGEKLKKGIQYSEKHINGKEIKVKLHRINDYLGNKLCERRFKNGLQDGISNYFYSNGNLSKSYNYKGGKVNGKVEFYNINGDISEIFYMKDDLYHGINKSYQNGKLKSVAYFYEDQLHGPFEVYHYNGNLKSVGYYQYGHILNTITDYSPDSKILTKQNYADGIFESMDYYTNEEQLDYKVSFLKDATNLHYTTRTTEHFFSIKNGTYDGAYTSKMIGGSTLYEKHYSDGFMHGIQTYYSPSGSKSSILNFRFDKYHGEAQYYNNLGTKYLDIKYIDDSVYGDKITYYPDGKSKRRVSQYYANQKNGKSTIFNYEGDTLVEFGYRNDLIDYYRIRNIDGQLDKPILIGPDKHKILSKYEDGTIAFETSIDKRYIDGNHIYYNRDGKILYESNNKNNNLHGVRRKYYQDGTLMSEQNFTNDLYEGTNRYFAPNGNLKISIDYKNDLRHGKYKIYENGSLIKTITYSYDTMIAIDEN